MRKEKQLAWLRMRHYSLTGIVDRFNIHRKKHLYNLNHNGQVCYLEGVLNDEFDRQERRIFISDGNQYERQYIYTDGELLPKYLGVIYLHQDADYSDTAVDFIVNIPQGLNYNEHKMKALINFYKLASKRYKIQNYE